MGEAVYYAKIAFDTDEECEKAAPAIKSFFVEVCNAEQFWQNNRSIYAREPKVELFTGEKFWVEFEKNFPLVADYLKFLGNNYADKPIWNGDSDNGLAGKIDIAYDANDVNYGFRIDGCLILYSAEVWHFADWDGFAEYIESRWGGKMNWLSDEYVEVDIFNML